MYRVVSMWEYFSHFKTRKLFMLTTLSTFNSWFYCFYFHYSRTVNPSLWNRCMKTLVKTTPRKLSPWRPTLTSLGPLWHRSTPAGQWGQHKIIIIISVHINNDFKQNTKMWTTEKVHSFRTKIFFYLKKQSMINIRQVDQDHLYLYVA